MFSTWFEAKRPQNSPLNVPIADSSEMWQESAWLFAAKVKYVPWESNQVSKLGVAVAMFKRPPNITNLPRDRNFSVTDPVYKKMRRSDITPKLLHKLTRDLSDILRNLHCSLKTLMELGQWEKTRRSPQHTK
jgi:hypothetical protein